MAEIQAGRLYRSKEAKELLSIGNTKFWALTGTGQLEARRIGKAVVIPGSVLTEFVAGLPKVTVRAEK